MRRREFIAFLGSSLAGWPLAARAQQGDRMRRIGVLMNAAATEAAPQSYLSAFVDGLRQLGWTEGQNLRIDVRWNAGDAALARIFAAQLIGLQPEVILSASTTNLGILREVTNTIPIVFVSVSDPVAQGFVASIAKPGGNLTGFSAYEFSIGGKWLDLLKQIAPGLARVGVMFNPDTSPQSKFFMRSIEATAPSRGLQAIVLPIHATADIAPALENFARAGNGGLILPTDAFTRLRQTLIIELTTHNRLPTISAYDDFAKNGGLIYYGTQVNVIDQFRQAPSYVDRILKGAKPGDLPVQQPEKYTFVINLKAATALGLTVPLPLLGLADEVIE